MLWENGYMLQYKEYYTPTTIEELFSLMESNTCSFDIMAGGTDLYAKEEKSADHADLVIDISGLEDFSAIESQNGRITIGSNTRVQQCLEDQRLIDDVPVMRHAASYFADQQIREIATIGGNLANASPTGDMIPPLLAMDAVVHTVAKNEAGVCGRDIPMADFVLGVGKTPLARGEIIQSVSCPTFKGYGCAFKKVGLRRSLCISAVNSAFLVKADEAGRCFQDVRIAFGGIGPTPTRLWEIENTLKGSPISGGAIQDVLNHIPEDMIRSRSRKEYRKTVVRNFLLAGLYEALAEIGIAPA